MKITHHANSFIEIAEGDTNLLCDPWVRTANHGAWHVVPDVQKEKAIQIVGRATHIYISHLHSDHLCKSLLKQCDIKNKSFIISKFPTDTLRVELEDIGATSILQFDPWTKQRIGQFEIVIIPQTSSSTSQSETLINYNLDTSLLVYSSRDKIVFFNKVDNPLPLDSLSHVVEYSVNAFGVRPEVACFNVGAASEYPQCFLEIDREAERNRIIQQSLDTFEKEIAIIRPRFAFPAGGLYTLAGGRTTLNSWVAIPDTSQISERAINASPDTTIIELLGEGSIDTQNNQDHFSIIEGSWDFPKQNYLQALKFDYETAESSIDTGSCSYDEMLDEARNMYIKLCSKFVPNLDWSITINLYHNFALTDQGDIANPKIDHIVILRSENSKNLITINMDCRAFVGALSRKFSWNQLISGSHAMIVRQPNIFNPDVLFSLNFFRI